MPYQSPISPGISWYEDTRRRAPAISVARRRPPCRCRHHRRRLHRPVRGRPSRQIRRRRRADRRASLRRRRLGQEWRPTRHRPSHLSRRTRSRARLDARQGAVRPCRGSQGASPRIRIGERHRHRLHAGPALGRPQARYVDDYRKYADYMRERAGYPHISFMDAEGDRRASRLDALFRRHTRHRHRPHPSAEAHDRHGAGGRGSWCASVRKHQGHRPQRRPAAR